MKRVQLIGLTLGALALAGVTSACGAATAGTAQPAPSSSAAAEKQDSHTPTMEVLVLGGRPIREPVAWGGPFVMNTKAEVMQAFEDFQKGRMGQVPVVHGLSNDVVEG